MTPPPTIADRRPEVVTREIPSWREGWTDRRHERRPQGRREALHGDLAQLPRDRCSHLRADPDPADRPRLDHHPAGHLQPDVDHRDALDHGALRGAVRPRPPRLRGPAPDRRPQRRPPPPQPARLLALCGRVARLLRQLPLPRAGERALAAPAACRTTSSRPLAASTPGSAASAWPRSASSAGRST